MKARKPSVGRLCLVVVLIIGLWLLGKESTAYSQSPQGLPELDIVVMAHPNPVYLGRELVISIAVSNQGDVAATQVEVRDRLPATLDLISVVPESACRAIPDRDATTLVTCSFAKLAPGQSERITLLTQPTAAQKISNAASATAAEFGLTSSTRAVTSEIDILCVMLCEGEGTFPTHA
ncbi:MAG: hypothetical protein AAFY57_19905 [Cyanobacteria bacterium J06642_2]